MRNSAVLLFVASAALACAAACSDSDDGGALFGASAATPTGPAAPSLSGTSGAGASSSSSGAGGRATDASAGGAAAPDSAPTFDPATCECFPGTTRWCDPADGVSWGKQPCGAGGTWGACAVVPDAPTGCDGQPFNEGCCLGGTVCCESKDDPNTDPNGPPGLGGAGGGSAGGDAGAFDGSTSVGACDQVACPNAIASGTPFGRK